MSVESWCRDPRFIAVKKIYSLRKRVGLSMIRFDDRGIEVRRTRLCAVCRLPGHNYGKCEIRVRLDELDLPRWPWEIRAMERERQQRETLQRIRSRVSA